MSPAGISIFHKNIDFSENIWKTSQKIIEARFSKTSEIDRFLQKKLFQFTTVKEKQNSFSHNFQL